MAVLENMDISSLVHTEAPPSHRVNEDALHYYMYGTKRVTQKPRSSISDLRSNDARTGVDGAHVGATHVGARDDFILQDVTMRHNPSVLKETTSERKRKFDQRTCADESGAPPSAPKSSCPQDRKRTVPERQTGSARDCMKPAGNDAPRESARADGAHLGRSPMAIDPGAAVSAPADAAAMPAPPIDRSEENEALHDWLQAKRAGDVGTWPPIGSARSDLGAALPAHRTDTRLRQATAASAVPRPNTARGVSALSADTRHGSPHSQQGDFEKKVELQRMSQPQRAAWDAAAGAAAPQASTVGRKVVQRADGKPKTCLRNCASMAACKEVMLILQGRAITVLQACLCTCL